MEETKVLTHSSVNKWLKVQQQIALIAYFVLCFREYLARFGVETIQMTLVLNLLIVFAIDFRHARKTIWLLPFFTLLIIYNRDALALVDILAFTYILRGISINKIILINAIVLFICVFCWLYALALGVLKSEIWIMPKGIAYSLGFNNPNALGFFGFQILASLYLLMRRTSKILLLILVLSINGLFFEISVSRTPWFGGFSLAFVILLMLFHLLRPWMRFFVAILPVLLTILLVYFTKHIASYPELDVIFTTRFSLYASVLNQMSMANWLIGAKIPSGEPMDGSYMCLLFEGGIVALVLFLCVFFYALVKKFANLRGFLPFLIGMLACGVAENTFSSATALSVIFWFLLMNSDCLYGRTIRD